VAASASTVTSNLVERTVMCVLLQIPSRSSNPNISPGPVLGGKATGPLTASLRPMPSPTLSVGPRTQLSLWPPWAGICRPSVPWRPCRSQPIGRTPGPDPIRPAPQSPFPHENYPRTSILCCRSARILAEQPEARQPARPLDTGRKLRAPAPESREPQRLLCP